jgi:hypothetical protein
LLHRLSLSFLRRETKFRTVQLFEKIINDFYWFIEWYIISSVGCLIKMFAWRQVKFMGLCGKKRRKNLWDCVQRNIKNIHTTKERLWENMNKNMQNKIKSAQKRSAFFPQLGCTWGHAQVIGLSQASSPARLGCPRLAGVVLAWVLPRIAGSGLLVYSTVYHWFVGLLV